MDCLFNRLVAQGVVDIEFGVRLLKLVEVNLESVCFGFVLCN